MSDIELAYMPAREIARLIRARELSVVEVVSNSLERIDEVNPQLNCFCFTYPDEALAKAQAADQALPARDEIGPLHGVPFAIKDLTPTKGKRTTLGSRVYETWVPDRDAAIVEALTAAGGIMVGKTTTPEFAHSGFCHSPLWGVTRNPWNPERTPGGSSGGSAAAVASGCVPLAEGTDMLGSVRAPAAYCGIVGLKPSLGRIPMDILPTTFDTISHFGPLARTVDDAALMLALVQGPDERDILSLSPAIQVPVPLTDGVRGKRLALSIDLGFFAIDPEVEANTRAAAAALGEIGAAVEEVEIGWTREVVDAGSALWNVFIATLFSHHLDEWRDRMDPQVVDQIEAGLRVSGVDYRRLEYVRTRVWNDLRQLFARYDALLCPTVSTPPKAAEAVDADFFDIDATGRFQGLELTGPFNLVSPCPALSVPSGFTCDGLPTGLQIVGRRHDDVSVLEIGAALERVRPWTARPPEA
jgi:Asp-tRNA(Asn)/Glu-tRNA(Gln) amidotransferase A subunit family amidase